MSTKIYNGFRVKGARTLDDAFALINTKENRQAVHDLIADKEAAWLARVIMRKLDKAGIYPDDPEITKAAIYAYSDSVRELADEIKKAKNGDGHSLVNFNAEVFLYPIRSGNRRYILGSYFMGESTLTEWFMGLPFIEEFGYWNNTDRPDEVTERQWSRRSQLWHEAFPGFESPVEAGVSIQLSPPNLGWCSETPQVVAKVRPIADRAREHAFDHISGKRMAVLRQKYVADGGDEKKFDIWGSLREANKYAKNEGSAEVERLTQKFIPLMHDLSKVDIWNRPVVVEEATTATA